MALLEKQLFVRKSMLPGAGKGLFTRKAIPRGALIVEYKGQIFTWKEVEQMPEYRNGYVFYVNSKHVIDAWTYKKALGRFANDARGLARQPGITTNSEYVVKKKRCYIEAIKNIPAGAEIFVEYGADYWKVIRYNARLEKKNVADAKNKQRRKVAKRQKVSGAKH